MGAKSFKAACEVAVWHGVRLLNKKKPGWENQIETRILDLGSSSLCVLGQNFYGYSFGRQELDLTVYEGYMFGFDINPKIRPENMTQTQAYSILTEIWIDEISKLRKKNQVV